MLLSDGCFEIDLGLLVYGKTSYYGKKYMAALKPLLLESEDLRILVDTGIGELPEKIVKYFKPDRSMTIEKSLRKVGLSPEDITTVVNTHLHVDHCGNNRLFKGARFVVQEIELAYAENPHRFQKGAYVKSLFDASRFRTVSGTHELTEDVTLMQTPGHTPGHQSVIVEGDKRYVYCGDIAPLKENYERRNIVGVLHNSVEALASLDALREMGGRPIFSHDNEQLAL
ncbi:MAG: N-acyl homoserine lactonase family protein [Candidatus Thermoplasmatota archaeon]|nr:N-acyl homoserine lactonase family protein [Candidatus Thermoplasmatota archaeon]